MGTSKVTRNFQVTIPKEVRERLRINEGDTMTFTATESNSIELRKADKKNLEASFGLWKDMDETGLEYVRRVRKQWDIRRF